MRSQHAGRIVRQRKLNRNTAQQVLREDQIESSEYESLQGQNKVETGVEKSEESEYHLQAALTASSAAAEKVEEIPAPPAQESTEINHDALYRRTYDKPATYIRFSQTVEECTGSQYDMTTQDDIFLKAYNQNLTQNSRLSEDDFERVMEVYEDTAEHHAPFASVDNTVILFDTVKSALEQQVDVKVQAFAKSIYEHWKACRQASSCQALQPGLKFETHQDQDDGDPYVCFRRREIRQTRKTRQRDVQSTEKLKRLRKELEEGRQLVMLAHQRELSKLDLLKVDRAIFDQRAKVKEIKVRLGIKSDDEDLINQKSQKRRPSDYPTQRNNPGAPIRMASRADGRSLEADLVQLKDVISQKENMLQIEIKDKAQQHRKWNQNHIDLTQEALSPLLGHTAETGFRPATTQYQYLMTPPSSVTSDSFDHPSPTLERSDEIEFRYSSPPEDEAPRPAFRRRYGRGGRLWIDRRGMSSTPRNSDLASDQWRYDEDEDYESPIYEMDPHSDRALAFRASIPLPPYVFSQRARSDDRSVQSARSSEGSPLNSRCLAVAQQPQPRS